MLLHISVMLAGLVSAYKSALDGPCYSKPPIYSNDAPSAFLPFSNKVFPGADATFNVSVQTNFQTGQKFNVSLISMDTGSLGMIVSAATLEIGPLDLCGCKYGNEFLSSSGVLWEGCWVNSSVFFNTSNNQTLQANIPVLAVTESSKCTSWIKSNGTCAKKENITYYPTGLHYMGVGFGRSSKEQPQATPDKNPFLNVVSLDGQPVQMHKGYVINYTGVYVGLTADNTENFNLRQLTPLIDGSMPDWNPIDMSISINELPYDSGTALFDTGIDGSYVLVDKSNYESLQKASQICTQSKTTYLCPDATITVKVGDPTTPIATYSVVVGDHNSINAVTYILETPLSTPAPAFINTGRRFYYGFEAVLDADCGWFGLAEAKSAIEGSSDERDQVLVEL